MLAIGEFACGFLFLALLELTRLFNSSWDAEIESSYGWVESVGCADRSAFDLTQHSRRTGERLVAQVTLPEPILRERWVLETNKPKFGPAFKKNAKAVQGYLDTLVDETDSGSALTLGKDSKKESDKMWNEAKVLELQKKLEEGGGKTTITGTDGQQYELTSDLVKIYKLSEKINGEFVKGLVDLGALQSKCRSIAHSLDLLPVEGDRPLSRSFPLCWWNLSHKCAILTQGGQRGARYSRPCPHRRCFPPAVGTGCGPCLRALWRRLAGTWDISLNRFGNEGKKGADLVFSFRSRSRWTTVREFVPNVIEPSFGIGRILYGLIEHSWYKRPGDDEARNVLGFPVVTAPFKALVTPISSNAMFSPFISECAALLRKNGIPSKVDESSASIGRRYARADELGMPFAITVDFQTLKDNTVTLRERDSLKQIRESVSMITGNPSTFLAHSFVCRSRPLFR